MGATVGILRTLVSLLKEEETSHVACAFDHVIESFRNELFSGYKTGAGIDPDLLTQFPLAERAASALGTVVWPMVEFEADDALATAAARFREAPGVDEVVICSPDKDLAQSVIGTRVVCLDRRRKLLYDEARVREKFGVSPASIPDWLALVGDAADGYPGIPRWGEKSAALVLGRFGHLEDIPRDPGRWGEGIRGVAALRESLAAHWDEALLYRKLATLRTDVPLRETLEDLRWRGARRSELESLCRELEALEILDQVTRWRA